MSLSFSSISEYALTELPFTIPETDLEIELFSDISVVKNLPTDTVALVLNYANDEIYPVYYGGNRNAWLAELSTTATDTVQQVFKFVDTVALNLSDASITSTRLNSVEISALSVELFGSDTTRYEIPLGEVTLTSSINSYEQPSWLISDPTVLSLDGNYFHNLRLYSNETGELSIDLLDSQFVDETPNDTWRDRPGLPIGPISFNAIGSEQNAGFNIKSYPLISEAPLEINLNTDVSITLAAIDSGSLIIADNGTQSATINESSSGNLTTFSISDQVVFLNSEETGFLEISASDQIQQSFAFDDAVVLEINGSSIFSNTMAYTDDAQQEIIIDFLISSTQVYDDSSTIEIDSSVLESKVSSYDETLILNTEPNDLISIRYYNFSNAPLEVDFKTYAKEYTFLQQISDNNSVGISITIESSESFGTTSRPKQVWFG